MITFFEDHLSQNVIPHLYFFKIFVLDVLKMEGWDGHHVIFICKMIKVVKFPKEETSHCGIQELK